MAQRVDHAKLNKQKSASTIESDIDRWHPDLPGLDTIQMAKDTFDKAGLIYQYGDGIGIFKIFHKNRIYFYMPCKRHSEAAMWWTSTSRSHYFVKDPRYFVQKYLFEQKGF